jgi:hypothetical protein
LQEEPCDVVSISRACGQTAVIAEVAFVESSRKKATLPGDERGRIERGRTDIDKFAVNEVADFDGSERSLGDVGDFADVNSLLFAPIIMNEDGAAAVAIDLARPVAHAHTAR